VPYIQASTIAIGAVGLVIALYTLKRFLDREPDKFIAKTIVAAAFAKLAGTATYYYFANEIWGGADVARYVRSGRELAPVIRSGTIPAEAWETGTPFVRFLTGVVFAVVGPNEILGYVAFSGLSFLGTYLFLQALRNAVPEGNHRLYAIVVLFAPTMLFWPSTIGKDAWLVLCLGIASWGSSRSFTGSQIGYFWVAIGTLGMAMVRPHMAALFFCSFAIAHGLYALTPKKPKPITSWVVGAAFVILGGTMVLSFYADKMGRSDGESSSLVDRIQTETDEIFDHTNERTQRGDGEFANRPVRGPSDLIAAAITVPFRPHILETHDRAGQATALESMLLAMILIGGTLRARRTLRQIVTTPYLLQAAVYSIGFIVAFSNVGNFGILVRQRTQLLPFLLLIVALSRPLNAHRSRDNHGPLLVVVESTAAPHHKAHSRDVDGHH
jgi:hypothetical protein